MDPNQSTAADGLDSACDSEGQRDDTFYLPSDFPGADDLKEGDTITLKVVGKGEDGIEVENVSEDEPSDDDEDDIGTALGKHMEGSKSY